jgi:ATP-binding cassette subfamily C (CFTR/MRP) protein 1
MTADDDDFGPHMPGVFDFTILFEQSILSLLPSVLFVLLMSWRVAYLHRRPQRVSAGPLLWVKMAAVVVYACLQIAYAVHLILDKAPRTRTTITEAVIALVETIAVGLLSYTEHCKSTKPSALLSAYFVVTTVLDIALARTFWIRPRVRETAGIFTATLAVKTVLLCLEEIPKRRTVEGTATSRETSAGAINRTVFWWLNRLFYKGYRQVLRIEDLDDINEKLDSAKLLGQLEAIWYKERSDSPNSLLVCTLKAHKWQLLATVPPRLLSSGFMYAQPFLIDSVIRQIAMPAADMTAQVSSGLIGATLLVYVGLAATDVWYKHLSFQLVTMCRGGLVSLMFDKTLRLKTATIKDAAPVTLMTTDMDVIAGAGETLTEFWASLVDLPIGIYLLYRQVGYPGLFVLLPTVAMLVLSAVIAPAMEPATAQWNEAVQKRVGETANMLAQMKSIKMMGLTQYLHSRIHELRIDEIKVSEKLRWLMVHMYTLSVLSGVVTPMIVILSSIYWTKSGQGLSVAEAFTSLSIIVLVSQPLVMMLVSLMQIAGVFGSFSRIQAFLQLPEQKVQCHTGMDGEKTQVKHQVVSKDATPVGILSSRNMPTPEMGQPDRVLLMSEATFTSDEGMHLLTDISLAVHRGTLNMFTGKVGCGKSSLLKAIIGELVPESGSVCLAADSIAYCDQTPWLRNGTIRNNIIGQSSLDEERLTRAIHACALDQDVDSLPQGDLTIVGTGGITLSGGQKQRVALARAVYAQKSLVVLDDVFSGLDNTTARLVFNRLLEVDGVLRQDGTTVILATSNGSYYFSLEEDIDVA